MRLDTTIVEEQSCEESRPAAGLAFRWLHPQRRTHVLELGRGPWRIGRAATCEIVIDDHGASREHAELYRKGPLVLLQDLGSTNGTFVNAVQIAQVPVQAGSLLRIGDWLGVFSERPADAQLQEGADELLPDFYAGPVLRALLQPLDRVARSNLPVLIEGKTGTGKERLAQYVHARSGRTGPFHAINCAAIPAEVAESQFFGHTKGAFTGAQCHSLGHFRAADGGTLFLDEIAELPLNLQAKLLRVLQEQNITPLGETKAIPIDVRVVASCQQSLLALVEAQRFRADLRARLAGFVIELPALADRIEEVPLLFHRFLRQHSGGAAPLVSGKLIERLCLHDWPGNVRELELVTRELLVLHGHEPMLRRAHLPPAIRGAGPPRDTAPEQNRQLLALARALHAARGNLTHASASLGISRARAYRLLGGRPIDQLLAQFPRVAPSSQSGSRE